MLPPRPFPNPKIGVAEDQALSAVDRCALNTLVRGRSRGVRGK